VLVAELRGHVGPIISVRSSPVDNWILTCSKDGLIKIWDEDKHVLMGETMSIKLSSETDSGSDGYFLQSW
jgi:WD40 repeat protein